MCARALLTALAALGCAPAVNVGGHLASPADLAHRGRATHLYAECTQRPPPARVLLHHLRGGGRARPREGGEGEERDRSPSENDDFDAWLAGWQRGGTKKGKVPTTTFPNLAQTAELSPGARTGGASQAVTGGGAMSSAPPPRKSGRAVGGGDAKEGAPARESGCHVDGGDAKEGGSSARPQRDETSSEKELEAAMRGVERKRKQGGSGKAKLAKRGAAGSALQADEGEGHERKRGKTEAEVKQEDEAFLKKVLKLEEAVDATTGSKARAHTHTHRHHHHHHHHRNHKHRLESEAHLDNAA